MKNLLKTLQKIENFTVILTFFVMVAASFTQVVNRNLVQASVGWFEELARYCMIYMALLATELGLRDGTQISITVVTDRLKGALKKAMDIFARAVIIVFAVIAFWTSFTLLQAQLSFGQTSPGLGIPMYLPYFALPIGFGVMTVVQTVMLVGNVKNLSVNENRPENSTEERKT
ncbi:MAG: TRAP transporter small permease [Synergistaceae bacterium]|jgi:TRAP-type C4-dicarboxylate transport system permease small subunit|nr:TRAP transporter small permease [Synergistaceae bacterium]